MEHILRSLGSSVGLWLYVIAGGLCFAEAGLLVGMILPGETALLVAGVFCNSKYGDLRLQYMIPLAVVCAVAGDSVGYEFGRRFGPAVRRSRLGLWVGEERWTKVDDFITTHGGKAILLGRMTALLRALMPSMAGMSEMRYRVFVKWNIAGALIWAPACVSLGYAFSSALGAVGRVMTIVPIALIVLGVGVYRYRKVHRRDESADQSENEATA